MILQDDILERKVRERAPSYFGRYFRRVRVIPIEEWAETFSKIYNMETIPVVVGVNIPEGFQEKHPKVLVVQAGYDN